MSTSTLRAFRDQIAPLTQLQELDLKLDALKKSKAGLPVALGTLEAELAVLKAQQGTQGAKLLEAEKLVRQTQAAQELNQDRAQRANQRLETVGNTQEYQAANREIEQLKRQTMLLDEQIAKAKSVVEAEKSVLAGLDAKSAAVNAKVAQAAGAVSGEGAELDAKIGELMTIRASLTPQIERPVLSMYDRIRNARGGLGFVPATGGRCAGCNLMIPPQLFNQIQRGQESHQCPSCHRLLFA